MSKPQPYVGITGISEVADVESFMRLADAPGLPSKVMLGFTSSNKRLKDFHSTGRTSPSLHKLINKLLPPLNADRYLPMIHYYTPDMDQLAEQINRLFEPLVEADLCNAVQLNAEWPSVKSLAKIKDRQADDFQIVLQLPQSALKAANFSIVEKAKEYRHEIDYLLIDPSGGEGKDVDLERAGHLVNLLHEALPNTTIGIAGGFSAQNVGLRIISLSQKTQHHYCIDAQGKLRTKGADGVSRLDIAKCILYLANADFGFYLSRRFLNAS